MLYPTQYRKNGSTEEVASTMTMTPRLPSKSIPDPLGELSPMRKKESEDDGDDSLSKEDTPAIPAGTTETGQHANLSTANAPHDRRAR